MRTATLFESFKRNVWHSEAYSQKEKDMMTAIHRCFTESKAGTELPKELLMDTDGTPHFKVAFEDHLRSLWDCRLQQGQLYSDAQEMASDITEYMSFRSSQSTFNQGNANDPWNLVCYELLTWLTRDLSGAKCDDQTLTMVKARSTYLRKLIDADIFDPNDDAKRTMLGVITTMRERLKDKIIPFIKKEKANTFVRHHLAESRIQGKIALNYGFQFLYYVLRKTKLPPPADITVQFPVITETRSGKLLETLIQTPAYCKLFETQDPANQCTDPNPFIETVSNRLCIPKELLREIKYVEEVHHFLDEDTRGGKADDTGIYEVFRQDHKLITDFVEMHALLVELAKTFIACDEAYKSAGIGGDLLVYGRSNKQINELMNTLKKLCQALLDCHERIKATTKKQEVLETGKVVSSLSKEAKYWLKNYRKLPSINSQFEDTLTLCLTQANFIQAKSNEITVNQRIKRAQAQTLYFADTATILSTHVDHFLKGQQTPIRRNSMDGSSRSAVTPPARARAPSTPSILQRLPSSGRDARLEPAAQHQVATIPRGTIMMGKKSATKLTEQTLTQLDMRNSNINDHCVKFVAQHLMSMPNVEKVQLENNNISSAKAGQLWEALAQCQCLSTLKLSNNPNLFFESSLFNTSCNDSQELARITGIKKCSEFFRLHTRIKSVHLSCCGLTPLGANLIAYELCHNKSVEILDLCQNPLGDEGVAAICRALENNTTIRDFRIAFTGVSDVGALAVLELLKKQTQITDLMIEDEKISPNIREQINRQLGRNQIQHTDATDPFKNPATYDSHSRNY